MSLIGISCRPENHGFWYKISAPSGARFWAKYQVIGSSGHQTVGNLEGSTSPGEDWRYFPVHFEVMFAAVSEFEIGVPNLAVDNTSDSKKAHSLGGNGIMFQAAPESAHSPDEAEIETFSSPYLPYS